MRSASTAARAARAESQSDAGLDRLKAQLVGQLEQSGLEGPSFAGGGH